MKKTILSVSLCALIAGSAMFISSCSKDDTPPSVVINGSDETISLQGTYVDLGALATDDKDGTVIATSDASATNPNTDLKGVYTITYTATDKEGNVGTATRTVTIVNDADFLEGTYSIAGTCDGTAQAGYSQKITPSTTTNNKVTFAKFANYTNNTGIYGTVSSDGTELTIPFQSGANIGTGSGSCDIATHSFVSTSGSINAGTGVTITLYFTDVLTSPASCAGSTNCTETFTKQ